MRSPWPSMSQISLIRVRVFFMVGLLILFLVVSFIAGTHSIELPTRLYVPVVRLFCQPESPQSLSIALAIGGAVLPVATAILLAAKFLRGISSILVLVSTTLVVCLIAYHLSEVVPSGGVLTRGVFLGSISGLFAILTIGGRIALNVRANHDELSAAFQKLVPTIHVLCHEAVAVGYFAGVIGTLIGADILHICALLVGVKEITIGGDGVWDAVYLSGLFSLLFTVPAWVFGFLLARPTESTIPTQGTSDG